MSRGASSGPPTYVFVDASDSSDRPQLSRGLQSAWDQGPLPSTTTPQTSSYLSRAERRASRPYYAHSSAFDMSADLDQPSNGQSEELFHRGHQRTYASCLIPSYLNRSRYASLLRQQYLKQNAEQQEQARTQPSAGLSTSSSSTNLGKQPTQSTGTIGGTHRGVAQRVVERFPERKDNDSGIKPLPTRWSDEDRASGLEVSSDGRDVRFNGHLKSLDEAASIRADHPIPKEAGIYYYEVEVKSKCKDGLIGVGVTKRSTSLARQPGWEPDCFGYHGDDGYFYAGTTQGQGRPYGPKFTSGDVVGCGINFRTNAIFFTKNGSLLGDAYDKIKPDNLYPSVGLRKFGEHLQVNFGQESFQYDIDGLIKQEKAIVRAAIEQADTSKLHRPDDEKTLIRKLVGQFLTHEGYVETSKAFAEDLRKLQTVSPSEQESAVHIHDEADDMHAVHRQKIRMAILRGDIDRGLKYTRTYYPRVLDDTQNRDIYFRLRCRKFIEMIREYSDHQHEWPSSRFSNGHTHSNQSMTNTQMELDEQLQREASNGIGVAELAEDDMNMDGSVETLSKKRSYVDHGDLLTAAIEYGQSLRADFDSDPHARVQQELNDIFGLMAYPDPRDSSVGYLLDTSGRASIAEDLNGAILVSLGKPSFAALEKLCAQTTTFLNLSAAKGEGAAALVDVQQDILDM